MGAGASINTLSAEDLGSGIAALGKAYVPYHQEVVDNGISGEVIFKTVQDDEAKFKAYVEKNLNVTKEPHQTAMYVRYIKLINDSEGGGSADGKTSVFDIKDSVQRSPSQIMHDLFQLQVIPLDPSNVAAAVEEIATTIRASIGENTGADGKTKYDCFLSYRVAADADVAEKLYDKLTVLGFFPFLDKFKLKSGQPWKDGFLEGLKNSLCFVSLVSQKALACCKDKTKNHAHDNVLLEIQTALDYQLASGNKAYIVPVGIGEMVNVEKLGLVLRKFGGEDFGGYADVIDGSSSIGSGSGNGGAAPAAATAATAAAVSVSVPVPVGGNNTGTVNAAKAAYTLKGVPAVTLTGHAAGVNTIIQLSDGTFPPPAHLRTPTSR